MVNNTLSESDLVLQSQKFFLRLVAFLGIGQAVFFLFAELMIYQQFHLINVAFNLGTIILMIILLLFVKNDKTVIYAARLLLMATLFLIFYFPFFANDQLELGYFLPLFPLFAFFLTGKKEGILWLIFFGSVYLSLFVATTLGLIHTPLNTYVFLISASDLLFYLVVTYLFVDVQSKARIVLKQQANDLVEINNQLANEVETRKKTEQSLTQQTKQLSDLNKTMVDREHKMIELKKRVRELESIKL